MLVRKIKFMLRSLKLCSEANAIFDRSEGAGLALFNSNSSLEPIRAKVLLTRHICTKSKNIIFITRRYGLLHEPTSSYCGVRMGKGPKRTLELVDYRLESRPLPSESRVGSRLDSKPGSTKSLHVIIEKIIDLTIDFQQ